MQKAEQKNKRDRDGVVAFYKRKLFIVLMLLVCSGVVAAVATYAWFILSTAPEVKGVSATVGANGSLEIALLDETTGQNLSLIEADVGDSIYVAGAVEGNVTWGNLVDLSDVSYGLNNIIMYPSIVNTEDNVLDLEHMLSTAKNGADGRITRLVSNTVVSKYSDGLFSTENANYGVRAVGTTETGSNRELVLLSAKNSFDASLSSAKSAVTNTINTNGSVFISVAAGNLSGVSVSLNMDNLKSIQTMNNDIKTSLEYILTAYKQAIIATAAVNPAVSESDFTTIRTGVLVASAAQLSSYANNYPSGLVGADITKLASSIADIDVAIELTNALLYDNYGTDDQELKADSTTFTVDQISPIVEKLIHVSDLSASDISASTLVINSTKGAGILTDIADFIGNYTASISPAVLSVETTENSGNGKLAAINIANLVVPSGLAEGTATGTAVTNFYGYIVDLAFRTNAAADLQLQTVAADRVYTDGAGATMGEGSNIKYTFASGMSETQVKAMFSAVRAVFFDPDTGTGEVYGTAKAETPTIDDGVATAAIKLDNDTVKLMALETAVPKKLSVLVYLNGSSIDNMSVLNAENSGTMTLNLQFSSSVELKPMVDSELKNAVNP